MKKLGGDLYVIVGSADKSGTKRNPIPIDVRLDLINGALQSEYLYDDLKHIHVVPLDDLSDEANNTHTWGHYLYSHARDITKDTNFVFYYSDRPEIALSWFDEFELRNIWFKFLPRFQNISATLVRKALIDFDESDQVLLDEYLPTYVYCQADVLRDYIRNAK
jgi:nicotinamide mononucleotide adenylyltransferase